MMKVVCAYCGRDMGEKMGPDGKTSYGCCSLCIMVEENRMARVCTECGEKVAYDAPPEQFICDDCQTEKDARQEEEDYTCYHCRGCGEGQFEGTVCPVCHGSGTILTEAHQAARDKVNET